MPKKERRIKMSEWQERLKEEYTQLKEKYEKLKAYMAKKTLREAGLLEE